MTQSGIEPATFRLVVQCLNQLRHRVPPWLAKKLLASEEGLCWWNFCVGAGYLTLGRPKRDIRDPMSQHFNKFMRLMRIILSCSMYSLIVYISCIMQHVNNILIICFQKNYENLCPSHERSSFGFSCGYSIYMAKAVLEYFVRRVVTNSLEISFQRAPATVLTTNRGNAMIMWRECNWLFSCFY
jgi:hypothetical protein